MITLLIGPEKVNVRCKRRRCIIRELRNSLTYLCAYLYVGSWSRLHMILSFDMSDIQDGYSFGLKIPLFYRVTFIGVSFATVRFWNSDLGLNLWVKSQSQVV